MNVEKLTTCPVNQELADELIDYLGTNKAFMSYKMAFKAVTVPLMKRRNKAARGMKRSQFEALGKRIDDCLERVEDYDAGRRPQLEVQAVLSHNKSLENLPAQIRMLTEEAAVRANELLELTTEIVALQADVIQTSRLVKGFGARGYAVNPIAYEDIRTSWGQKLDTQTSTPEGGRAVAKAILIRAGLFQGNIKQVTSAPPATKKLSQE